MQVSTSRLKTGALMALLCATVFAAVPTGAMALPTPGLNKPTEVRVNVSGSGNPKYVALLSIQGAAQGVCKSRGMTVGRILNLKEQKRSGQYVLTGQAVCCRGKTCTALRTVRH